MAKVSKTKASNSPKQAEKNEGKEMKNIIIAEKGGMTRKFNRLIWDNLPDAKEGWKEIRNTPSEPKTAGKKADDSKEAEKAAAAAAAAAELKKSEDAKAAGKLEGSNTVVLTQDHLDANPELVESGLKVGDEIEIEEGGEDEG